MNEVVRPMDTVGRVGGDEFAVIVPGAGPDDTRRRSPLGSSTRSQTVRPHPLGVAVLPDRRRRPRGAPALRRREALRGQARTRPPHQRIKMTAKELSWATALARAVDERMAVQHEHSWKVAEHCVGDRGAARLGGARPRAPADGGHPARRRQGLDPGPHAAQAQPLTEQGMGGDQAEPGAGRGDGLAHPGARDDRAVDPSLATSASTAPAIRTA